MGYEGRQYTSGDMDMAIAVISLAIKQQSCVVPFVMNAIDTSWRAKLEAIAQSVSEMDRTGTGHEPEHPQHHMFSVISQISYYLANERVEYYAMLHRIGVGVPASDVEVDRAWLRELWSDYKAYAEHGVLDAEDVEERHAVMEAVMQQALDDAHIKETMPNPHKPNAGEIPEFDFVDALTHVFGKDNVIFIDETTKFN